MKTIVVSAQVVLLFFLPISLQAQSDAVNKNKSIEILDCCKGRPDIPDDLDPDSQVAWEKSSDLSNLSIYPNPSPGREVSIQFESKIEGPLYFKIVDQTGRILNSYRVESRKGINEWTLNCEKCDASDPYTLLILDKAINVLGNKTLLLNQ